MEVKDKDSLMAAIGFYLVSEFMKRENGNLTSQDVLERFKDELTLDNLDIHMNKPRILGRPCSICQEDPCCCVA